MDPIHFSLGSMAQYVSAGPFALGGMLGNLLLDICEADTEYQVEMARIEVQALAGAGVKKVERKLRAELDRVKKHYERKIENQRIDTEKAVKMYQEAITDLLRKQKRGSR